MKKSKEFIFEKERWRLDISFKHGNGVFITHFCQRALLRTFGLKFKLGEKKRVKVTIEEVK